MVRRFRRVAQTRPQVLSRYMRSIAAGTRAVNLNLLRRGGGGLPAAVACLCNRRAGAVCQVLASKRRRSKRVLWLNSSAGNLSRRLPIPAVSSSFFACYADGQSRRIITASRAIPSKHAPADAVSLGGATALHCSAVVAVLHWKQPVNVLIDVS